VGANETAHRPLAASGPHLPSLSFAPCTRHDLRQEPYAGKASFLPALFLAHLVGPQRHEGSVGSIGNHKSSTPQMLSPFG